MLGELPLDLRSYSGLPRLPLSLNPCSDCGFASGATFGLLTTMLDGSEVGDGDALFLLEVGGSSRWRGSEGVAGGVAVGRALVSGEIVVAAIEWVTIREHDVGCVVE